MIKKYMLFRSNMFGLSIDFPMAIFYWKSGKLRPTGYATHSYYQARRLNILQALYYYLWFYFTEPWMRPLKIKRIPNFWWLKKTESND